MPLSLRSSERFGISCAAPMPRLQGSLEEVSAELRRSWFFDFIVGIAGGTGNVEVAGFKEAAVLLHASPVPCQGIKAVLERGITCGQTEPQGTKSEFLLSYLPSPCKTESDESQTDHRQSRGFGSGGIAVAVPSYESCQAIKIPARSEHAVVDKPE